MIYNRQVKIIYRPEIDGLRAIAVGAVILYHAQITIFGYQPFNGGFIGVDIFFVISGYLITSIILKELVTTGSFSFKHFYKRRIRRILPALLFVMLVSIPFAWMCLLPISFIDFSKSILYSLGFSSNFYFLYSGQQYGDESGLLKPFLHTWSLSVEEQFYILFPIVLLVTFKHFRKYLIHILILGFAISLGLADWGSRNHPSFNFYVLPTRGWELLAGSILAYFEINNGHRSKNRILNLILPFIGLILIGHSIFIFNDEIFHPSFYTLSPIIGVCLIIWFSNKEEIITKILSTKLFVGIGLISYSLYLWHYPIFAFTRQIYFFDGSIIKKLFVGLIIIVSSIFSYYLIERPARNKNNKSIKVFYSLFCVMILLILLNVLSLKGFFSRYSNEIKESIFYDLNQRYFIVNSENEKCRNHKDGCSFNINSNKKIYIVGDSHMEILAYDLKERVISKSYQFNTSIITGCMIAPGFNLIDIKTQKITNCNNKYFSKIIKTLKNEKNSIIIFGGRYPVYLTNTYFDNKEGGVEGFNDSRKFVPINYGSDIKKNFKSAIEKISLNNYVILTYPIPEVGWHVPRKLLSQLRIDIFKSKNFKIVDKEITTSYEVYKKRTKSSFELLDNVKGKNIYRVYPHTLFCNTIIKKRCLTHDNENVFYVDYDHPSLKGAEMINNLIMKEIEKIELKSN